MKARLSTFLTALLAAGLLSSCLEFENQTLSYRYDEASDSLRIFQDYRGIFGGEAGGKAGKPLSSEEMAQLGSVLKGQRTFFFSNWILEYNRAALVEAREDLNDPETRAEMKMPAESIAKIEKLMEIAIANVRVENGPFYLGPDGKLCGVQSVTVTRLTPLLEAINACAPLLFAEQVKPEESSPEDRRAVARFSGPALAREGNALTLRVPISRASYDKAFGPGLDAEDAAWIAKVRAAGLGISFADDVATFTLGKPGDETTALTLGFRDVGTYVPNALEPARKLHRVEDDFDPAAASRKFLLGAGAGGAE